MPYRLWTVLFLSVVACLAWTTGWAGAARRAIGLPSLEEAAQWTIHLGTSVALPRGNRTLVFLVTGQSNAGNYGRGARRRSKQQNIYNVYRKTLWMARDPLLGSDGLGISPWIPFAENLVERGMAQSVVLALAVRGGMGVREWNPGAPMRTEVFARVADLRAIGLSPDYLLWQQGEEDAPFHTRTEDYTGAVRGLVIALRESGISSPVLIAQATRIHSWQPDNPIRYAQIHLADSALGILRGPDADLLGPGFRYDGLHFSETGIAALSRIWADAVFEAAQIPR